MCNHISHRPYGNSENLKLDSLFMIEVRYERGVYLPKQDLWLDPWDAKRLAFISHAHSDHIAPHQGLSFPSRQHVCFKVGCRVIASNTFCHSVVNEPCMASVLRYCTPDTSLVRRNVFSPSVTKRCCTQAISNCVRESQPNKRSGATPKPSSWKLHLGCRVIDFRQRNKSLIK